MRGKLKGILIAAVAIAALAAGGAAIAGATGGEEGKPITGSALDRASAIALKVAGGGKVSGTEAGDEEGYYQVEVTRPDGTHVDVNLDRAFHVVKRKVDDEFTTRIDNPYLPLVPGSRWAYHDVLTGERTQVRVTSQTKRIANGVTARVVRDTVRKHGHVTEDTFDWYAQDERGNVWYMGEDTKEYAHGKVSSTEGSWEAGVDGARAGIAMPAHPRVGRAYRQEFYAGHAEDHARVLSLDDQVEVPAGHYKRALLTKEWTPLEPDVLEYKLYARGVGVVLESTVSGGAERNELVSFHR